MAFRNLPRFLCGFWTSADVAGGGDGGKGGTRTLDPGIMSAVL